MAAGAGAFSELPTFSQREERHGQASAAGVSRDVLFGLAKHDPEGFWRTSEEKGLPPAALVEVLFDCQLISLSGQHSHAVLHKLLHRAVMAECDASLSPGSSRGSTPLYAALCHAVIRRYEGNCRALGSSESFLSNLDFFLGHCTEPGETCLVLAAAAVLQCQLAVQTSLEPLTRIYSRHLPLFAEYKQQAKLSFVPWLDAERLLLAVSKAPILQVKQAINDLKATHRSSQP